MNTYSGVLRIKVEGYQIYQATVEAESFEDAKKLFLQMEPMDVEGEMSMLEEEVGYVENEVVELLRMKEESQP